MLGVAQSESVNNSLRQVLNVSAPEAAKLLLGAHLTRQFGSRQAVVRIVETEAYDSSDAASHSFKGQTNRTAVMFGPAGFLYVYFTYGMHYCCNIVTGDSGNGSAVLIRAVEPVSGIEVLRDNRVARTDIALTNGPAKLCQSLAIDASHNGHDLEELPLQLSLQKQMLDSEIMQTTRIGISKSVDVPWRFYIRDNPYVSFPL